MNRVLLQVKLCYEDMGRAEKRAADFLREHADEVPELTISELAERCDTSEATLVRLARRLGFGGFQQMKLALAQDTVHRTVTPNINKEDNCSEIFEKVCNDVYLSLERTKRTLAEGALERASDALAKAGRIVLVGLGSSAAVAQDAASKLLRAGCDASSYSDTHMQTVAVSYLGSGDVAVGVSQSGASRDIVEALKLARAKGCTTICITGRERSPITRHSDIVLLTDTEELRHTELALSSHLSRLAVTDALCYRVAYCNEERIHSAHLSDEGSLKSKRVEE